MCLSYTCLFILVMLNLSSNICEAGLLDPFSWARADNIEIATLPFIPWLPFENETRCYDEIGCLNITRSWYHLINRPLNVFPLPRIVINTRFILYTRLNPKEGTQIRADEDSLAKIIFDPKKKTKVIIHGFIDTILANWVKDMKDELLKHTDVNVILVDWAGGSLPLYTQATANTRLVALELAHLLNYLINNLDLKAEDVHLIGHSLGAHLAGYTGSMIPNIGRITGLDPAEPYFQGMPSHVRLDPSDAKLVDVIHTDGKGILLLDMLSLSGYGMSQPCGHFDFYPNNGKEQPGCEIAQSPLVPLTLIKKGLEEASRVLVACNHIRSIKLFIDSIGSQCPYIAHQCSSYDDFMSGKCFICKPGTMQCAMMGYHLDSSPIFEETDISERHFVDTIGSKYFLNTGKDFPFCHRIYRISIELAKPSIAEKWVQGFLKAFILSPNGIMQIDLTPSGDVKLEHGTTYTTVVTHRADLGGNIKKIELNWEYDMNVLEPRTLCLLWCNDHLYIKRVYIDEMEFPSREKREIQFSSTLCARKGRKDFVDIPNRGRGVLVDTCK
ncbi:pancreatic triacylglycerol lipase-like isoform X1 [Harmonia axyridis]|uniref:pancreatic triacylglycerol lipase-like isoform X1 n=1 Tax=Harmonia axyridis TaxID=115357 RepID=UPI001E275CEE|nr:pancreatic triacylglycerol lipase-like isoform X1 [Harmonia axyridis]XP_045475715.1 pancreatic triacylglycerol lipase-like isoform X1 [Harmonia axyridis]